MARVTSRQKNRVTFASLQDEVSQKYRLAGMRLTGLERQLTPDAR